jgi:hypothetical protein
MSKKVNWAEVDKRIRGRRSHWSAEEAKTLEAALAKLPDMADKAENITIAQPAVGSSDGGEADEAN